MSNVHYTLHTAETMSNGGGHKTYTSASFENVAINPTLLLLFPTPHNTRSDLLDILWCTRVHDVRVFGVIDTIYIVAITLCRSWTGKKVLWFLPWSHRQCNEPSEATPTTLIQPPSALLWQIYICSSCQKMPPHYHILAVLFEDRFIQIEALRV